MYKNISDMAAHKKGLYLKYLFLKNIFSSQFTVFNHREQSFTERNVSYYFTKVVVTIHSFVDTVFILEEHFQP